jgi:hypothetical protein
MKRGVFLICAAILSWTVLFTSCKKIIATGNSTETPGIHEEESDYVLNTSGTVNIHLADNASTADSASVMIEGNSITVTTAGTYHIYGKLTDGQLKVDAGSDDVVKLILDGTAVNCSTSSALFIKKSKKTVINLADGSVNNLSDGASYVFESGSDEPQAAVFSKSDLAFFGTGSLSVTGNYNDAISSKDGLIINGGNFTVSSVDDGIRGKDFILVHSGNITVNCAGDGLKSDNDTDDSLGFISIQSGTFSIITTGADAIDATTSLFVSGGRFNIKTGSGAVISAGGSGTGGSGPGGPGGSGSSGGYSGTASEKGLKALASITITAGYFYINTADDGLHSHGSVTVLADTLDISSGDDAIHADKSIEIKGGVLIVEKSYETLESAIITVDGGQLTLNSYDDCFNATMGSATEYDDGSVLYLKGGNITVNATSGDGIDSNGKVYMSGGTVVVNGPSSAPEVGIDVNGDFIVSGGFLFASGPNSGNMIEAISSSSAQNCILVKMSSTLSASSLFNLQNSDNVNLVTWQPVRSTYYVVVSTADLKTGSSYSIYTGGSTTGTLKNGIYDGGVYSGGVLKKSFSVTARVTTVTF